MFNLNEKYFSISKRCGRNHQNKFLFTSPQGTIFPWELSYITYVTYGHNNLVVLQERGATQTEFINLEILKSAQLGLNT